MYIPDYSVLGTFIGWQASRPGGKAVPTVGKGARAMYILDRSAANDILERIPERGAFTFPSQSRPHVPRAFSLSSPRDDILHYEHKKH
jgi:hypothetical protein